MEVSTKKASNGWRISPIGIKYLGMDEPAERERRLRETKHLEKTTQHVTENDNLISISPQLSPIERARPLGEVELSD